MIGISPHNFNELSGYLPILHCYLQYVQKHVENYKELKEDTVWSMEKFNDYVNENLQEEKELETDWVLTHCEVSLIGRLNSV